MKKIVDNLLFIDIANIFSQVRKRLKIILPFVIKVELEPCNNLLIKVFFFLQIYEPPFYVAVDHDCQAVVVSIRGSLSMQASYLFNLIIYYK